MKKSPHSLPPPPKRAIFETSPPGGATKENAMHHRTGQNRQQFGLFVPTSVGNDMIAPDNPARVIHAFVDAIDLDKLGFTHAREIAAKLPNICRRGANPNCLILY